MLDKFRAYEDERLLRSQGTEVFLQHKLKDGLSYTENVETEALLQHLYTSDFSFFFLPGVITEAAALVQSHSETVTTYREASMSHK